MHKVKRKEFLVVKNTNKIEKIRISNLSNQELLDIIYREYMRIKPKNHKEFYDKNCLPSTTVLRKRFNMKYNDILLMAGVPEEYLYIHQRPESYYINLLNDVAKKLGHCPTRKELEQFGQSSSVYIKRFGSYTNALKLVGLSPIYARNQNVNRTILLNLYKDLCNKLGRAATANDINNSNLPYKATTFAKYFGGLNNLREEAGFPKENRGMGRKKYTKELILHLLIYEYINNEGPLTIQEIEKNDQLPAVATILKYFRTGKITEVWNEVSAEAVKQLKNNDIKKLNAKKHPTGVIGENNVSHNLKFLDPKFTVYNNINIFSELYNESQQIDHLVIGPTGIFVLETKHLYGEITVKNNNLWEQYTNSTFRHVENPTGQVMRHENLIKSIILHNIKLIALS